MMRGWITAAAVSCLFTGEVLAQSAGQARYRQPSSPQSRYTERTAQAQPPSAQQRYHDANVVQAAARSPRESAQNRTRKSQASGASKTSILSKLGIPNLLPKSLRSDGSEPIADEAPMPYDPAEVTPTPRQSRPATSRATSVRQSTPPMRQQPAPTRVPSAARTMGSSTAPTTSRISRSSPPISHRRNELADALSGLTGANDEVAAEDFEVDAPAVDEVVSPIDEEESLPSYLQGSRSVARTPAAPKARRTAAAPLDIRDALLGSSSKAAVRERVANSAADAATESDSLGSIPAPSAQAPDVRERAATAPAPASSAEAAVPSSTAKEAFGAVDAAMPSPAFEVDAPMPDVPAMDAPSKIVPTPPAPEAKPAAVLSSTAQPVIISNIEGPQQIVVGKQAEYRITVENKGDATAQQLTGTIVAPEGAEVVDAIASNGVVERSGAEGDATTPTAVASNIHWQLYELAAGARQTLTIQLIPRSGRELNLGVQWVHAPVMANATVVIQEPKLQMDISGPAEVLFGKSQRYALTISNPGNGSAEEVSIELTPPGGTKDSVVKHKVGALGAGESKKIELELTAREAGELKIQAAATAAGNLHADTLKTVLCRKPELQIDWRGPEKKYAGAVATYYIRLRNPGTAPAEQVGVQMVLPAGAELVEASEGNAWDADRRTVVWKAAGLKPGEERFMELQCRLTQAGVNKLELTAQTATGDLSDAKSVPVTIEALADLKLEVVDPKGVIPVGDEAVYEIHITNRGMNAARGVNVVGMFSEGIDPTQVEGAQHTMRDGRVTFRTIDALAAGSETVLKIKAKAAKPGTHVFRAEVACDELEAKLAAEETTRFFNEEQRWADASTAYSDDVAGTQTR